MKRTGSCLVLFLLLFLISCSSNTPVQKKTEAPAPKEGTVAAKVPEKPATAQASSTVLEGYRSARFGMTEQEVRQAIARDFGVKESEIFRQVQPAQRTVILTLMRPELAPHKGPGHLFYVFGYQSKRLMQVNILWGKPATQTPQAEKVIATAHGLRDEFLKMPFNEKGKVVNKEIAPGIVWLFRGTDGDHRGVDLFLINPQKPGQAANSQITLRLSYMANTIAPDIYKAKK